jgi:hypothetical protein
MYRTRLVLLLIFASAKLAGADVVGTLNVHTARNGHIRTGLDTGLPVPVQVDFSRTQDGAYDITIWSGDKQIGTATRINIEKGKPNRAVARGNATTLTIYCPGTDLMQNGPTTFQIFIQAVLDDSVDAGKVLITEASWQVGLVEDGQPGAKVEPRPLNCLAGSNLDSHATGSFFFQNQSDGPLRATLMFGGRKYGDFDLSGHGNQRIQADAWGVNPGVGWYVTTANPNTPGSQEVQAAGPIYNTEGGSDAGDNRVDLTAPNPTPTPSIGPLASPTMTTPHSQ